MADYKVLSKSSDGEHWIEGNCHEFGRLSQGYKDTEGTDTIHFIPVSKMPADRKATYFRPVCADRPNKAESRRVRHTVGGDKIDYPYDVSTKTAGLITSKILFNSIISTDGAKCLIVDINN